MKIFLDSANLQEIKDAHELGVIAGVTTNPTLVAKEEGGDFLASLQEISKIVRGPLSAEVLSEEAEGMVKEGQELAKINSNIFIKIPCTLEGLKATAQLTKMGIPVNMTLIFSANQALLAARAGAKFVSPFVGRLDDIGTDGIDLVAEIAQIFALHDIKTEIIAASIRHPQHVIQAALAGAHIATIPYRILLMMIEHPLTSSGIMKFLKDWEKHKNL